MTNSREKLINVYLHILNYYSSGGSAFVILKTLREEYQRNQEKEDDIFLGTVVISCFNSVIIVLANTIKPNSDSIHLYYLFNCIKNSKELFNPKTYNQLVSMISEVELELKKLSNITDIVKKI